MSPYLLQVIPTYPNTMPSFQSMSCDRFCTCARTHTRKHARTDGLNSCFFSYLYLNLFVKIMFWLYFVFFFNTIPQLLSLHFWSLDSAYFAIYLHNFLPSQDKDACLLINMAFPKSKNNFINTCLQCSVETLFGQKLAIHAYESTLQVVKNSYTELTNTALALAICWCTSSLQMSKARVYRSA